MNQFVFVLHIIYIITSLQMQCTAFIIIICANRAPEPCQNLPVTIAAECCSN